MCPQAALSSPDPAAHPGLVAGDPIHGVRVHRLEVHRDSRGSFTEIFRDSWDSCITPVQWSVVHSQANVFRGMHLHRRHDEFFMLASGRCHLGLRDIRPDSPTRNVSGLYELGGERLLALSFPRGLLHGWYFHEPSIHIQSVSENYSDYGGDDNLGVHWSDPALELDWPFDAPIVAERAGGFPTLAVLLRQIGW